MTARRSAASFVLGSIVAGCFAPMIGCAPSAEDGVAASESAHTEGELIWKNDPHQWADIARADYDHVRNDRTSPEEHPLSRRLQAWVDLYDAEVRTVVRAQIGSELVAPRPRVRLVANDELNARIALAPACITPELPQPGNGGLLFMHGPRNFQFYTAPDCYNAPNWPASSGVSWFNALGGYRLEPSESGVAIIDGTERMIKGDRVAITSLAPFINVNTGLVAELTEKATAIVLAHELGHYYRAHLTASVTERYDFWFERDQHLPARPVPAADQNELRQQYERLALPRHLVPGQKFHPRVTETLLRWVDEMNVVPGHVCESAVRQLDGLAPEIKDDLLGKTTDHEPLGGHARAALLDLERAIGTCVDGLELDASEPPSGATPAFAGRSASRAWFTQRISDSLRAELPPAARDESSSLQDLVAALEDVGRALDEQAPELLKRLADNRIGLYTYEQEADDIALELATRIGFTPEEVIAGFVEMMMAYERADPESFATYQGVTASECSALVTSRFRASGREVHVPLGPLGVPHHGMCYRLFNLQREQEAHRYRAASPAPQHPAAVPSWAELQEEARRLQGR